MVSQPFFLDFEKANGLICAVAQDWKTNEVLMVAHMNKEAYEETCHSGIMHYYSRSRQSLWKKGESSGHLQEVKEMLVDCDRDALVCKVKQRGAACHEGFFSCFFRRIERNAAPIFTQHQLFDPKQIYSKP